MESAYKERLKYFRQVLSIEDEGENLEENWTPVIDIKSFREACFHGIPDEPGLRSTAWKVLLGYLPSDKRTWKTTLKSQRLDYYNWVKDLLEEPGEEPPSRDHPLNAEPGSKWAAYLGDNSILEQIDKDVRRTLPDFAFFQLHVPMNPLNPLSPPLSTTIVEEQSVSVLPLNNEAALDPLSNSIVEEPVMSSEKDSMAKRFSFGFMGRPRSSSAASRKSLKAINNSSSSNTIATSASSTTTTANNSNTINIVNPLILSSTAIVNGNNTRARSDSKSSVRSFSSGILLESGPDTISTPRSIVRKLSTAFNMSKLGNSHNNKKPTLEHIEPICSYIPSRRSLFRRIAHLNEDIGNREHQDNGTEHNTGVQALEADTHVMDYHWEVIERILFIYAKLNPGVGYVQGMNEILAPIYYVFAAKAAEDDPESQAYAEADSFFVFTTLMADCRDHFVRSLDLDASTGINATMWRMSQRLAWFDRPLFRDLSKKDLKEQYYAFRWITVLCSQEWDLPDVIRLWDSILADRGMQEVAGSGAGGVSGQEESRLEFLLDFAVAMLICIRQELIKGDFADNMRILQNYPLDDMQIVLNSAYSIRGARLQAIASGRIIPGVNDRRCSGLFNGDFSDTSSISSTGSGSLFNKKLRDTTDMARASLDSLRRGSKESLDDLFKRGLSITARNNLTSEDLERKRASTGDMARSISQKFSFSNSLAAKVRRTSSVQSVNNVYLSPQQQQQPRSSIEEQIHRDWLLANQLSAVEQNNTRPLMRQNYMPPHSNNSIPSAVPMSVAKSNSFLNRFSQFVSSKPISPLQQQQQLQQQQSSQQHFNETLKKTASTDSSASLSLPNGTAEEKKQLPNVLNTRGRTPPIYKGYA